MFKDRVDAGNKLAERLRDKYENSDAIVLAIPRGGVVVGDAVAKTLGLPLDLVIPRKIGAPGNPELAIGATAMGNTMIDEELVKQLGVSREYIEAESARQNLEIERRRKTYLGDRRPLDIKDRIVLIVDDGLATGFTALSSIAAVKDRNPLKTVLAVPVAPVDTFERLKNEVDELVCLQLETVFFAVGQFYRTFDQTADSEVIDILSRYS